jgi:hypothetical protein
MFLPSVAVLLLVAVLFQRFTTRPPARPAAVAERFTLRLSPTQLGFAGERAPSHTFELADVDTVVGGDRLVVRLRSGKSVTLPACLPDRDHRALAAALAERIADVRAAHTGYRGGDERLRIAAMPGDEEAEQEAEAEQVRARRHAR